MSKKITVPLMLLSLGIFAATCSIGCGSSNGGGGTGGKADGGGTGGKADAGTGTGGKGTGGGTGTGGRVDAGTDVTGTGGVGTGGRIDSGTDVPGTGGAGGTGTDAGTDTPADMAANDAPADVPATFDGSTAFDGAADASGQTRAAVLCPHFPGNSTNAMNGSMEASDYCSIFTALCGSTVDAGDCIARYNGTRNTQMTSVPANASYGTIGTCESAHLCNVWANGSPTDAGNATHCPHAAGLVLCIP